MGKLLEIILMGIGGLMFAFAVLFWLGILASPLIFVFWFAIKPMLADWSALNTFGLLMAFGIVGFIFLVATWGDNNKAVN